ncbi:MAG: 2-dehydropantoate 2-reductase [Dysgonamonadaceae bacterium]|jgi:2-dehydropantoate 2-reductase|nr:2-dehydropantoate 2-reductase [Dysgonamonadaceae bacterium]
MADFERYLVVGAGGVGGSIAGFLALAGKNVTCIARGAHLKAIRENGLTLISDLKGKHTLRMSAYEAEEYTEKADVIFVCVKGYSLNSVADLLRRASHAGTLIVPVLNVYGTGERIQSFLDEGTALDGCIYIVSFVSAPGEITQMGRVFRLVFGIRKDSNVAPEKIESINSALVDSGIHVKVSDDINRDTFVKWSYISAMACTGACFDVPMRDIQREGKERDVFIELSRESAETGRKLGIAIPEDILAHHLRILDSLAPESTASMQKDIARGHQSEINDLLFNMIRTAERCGVNVPVYRMVAEKFKNFT